MAEGNIRLPQDSTGKRIRTETITVNSVDVEQQVASLADPTTGALIGGDATNGLDVDVTRLPSGDNTIGRVKLTDGTDVAQVTAGGLLQVDASGATVPVSAASLPLPSGAASAANQSTANTSLASIDGKITAVNTGAVVVSSSALPSGAATAANQSTGNTSLSSIDGKLPSLSGGRVPVDGSGVTQPVSGTVTASMSSSTNAGATAKTADYDSGAGTDTVTMFGVALPSNGGAVAGGTATNPLRTDPTGTTTQPVSAASLPLPSGAATSAKQPALGTAGSASSDVITVQGVASMTPLKTDGSGVTQPVSASSLPLPTGASTLAEQQTQTTSLQLIDDAVQTEDAAHSSGDKGFLALGVRRDADTSPVSTDGDYHAPIFDNAGNLKVNIKAGSASGTQYTEADTDSSITGTAVMWEDTSDTLRAVSAAKPLPVNVVAGSTAGTEYTEGDADASISGSAMLWEDTSDTLRAVSAAKPLPVNVVAGSTSGTEYTEGDTDTTITGTAILWEDASNTLATVNASKPLPVVQTGTLNINNVSGTVSLPTGASTLAEQQSQTTHLSTIAGAVRAEDVASANAHTGVVAMFVRKDTPANTSGTDGDYEMPQMSAGRVWTSTTVDAALPAGTNAIGKLAANDGVDIGDVTINNTSLTVAQGTAANLNMTEASAAAIKTAVELIDDVVFAEDAAHTTGDKGVMALSVRKDSAATTAGTDGDYAALTTDASGRLHVNVGTGSVTANAGTNLNTSALALESGGNLATIAGAIKAEDAAHSSGHVGIMALAVRSDTAASTAGTDGDYTALITDSTGKLHVNVGNTVTVASHAVTNAGTFAVQESGGALTSLQLIDDVVKTDDAAFTPATDKVLMIGAQLDNSSPDSVDEGDAGALRMSANRNLFMNIRDAAGNERGANVNASNQLSVSVDNTVTVASHAVTNAGTFAVQVDGSALTALQLIDDTVFADDAAFTVGTSKVSAAGFLADESSTDSVDEGDVGAARMTLDRKLIVTPEPHTAGGLSIFRSLDLDETEEDVKTSAGCVYGWAITNRATSTRWIKFYNLTAANTTVGSSTPVITWGVPGNSTDNVSANMLGGMGIMFDTAICVAATTSFSDADTGAPGANDVIINVFYK